MTQTPFLDSLDKDCNNLQKETDITWFLSWNTAKNLLKDIDLQFGDSIGGKKCPIFK